jgi:hypothetical protein
MSSNHIEPDMAVEIFVLARPSSDNGKVVAEQVVAEQVVDGLVANGEV